MTDDKTPDSLFSAARPNPKNKAEITDSAAREILTAEVERRQAKTLRLKAARLEMEAQQPAAEPVKRRATKK